MSHSIKFGYQVRITSGDYTGKIGIVSTAHKDCDYVYVDIGEKTRNGKPKSLFVSANSLEVISEVRGYIAKIRRPKMFTNNYFDYKIICSTTVEDRYEVSLIKDDINFYNFAYYGEPQKANMMAMEWLDNFRKEQTLLLGLVYNFGTNVSPALDVQIENSYEACFNQCRETLKNYPKTRLEDWQEYRGGCVWGTNLECHARFDFNMRFDFGAFYSLDYKLERKAWVCFICPTELQALQLMGYPGLTEKEDILIQISELGNDYELNVETNFTPQQCIEAAATISTDIKLDCYK